MLEKLLSRIKIFYKVFLLSIVLTVCFMLVLGWLYIRFRNSAYEARQAQTRNLVETTSNILGYYAGQVRDGSMSEEEAKRAAVDSIRVLRYGDGEYFWINDTQPRMIMHPIQTQLEGQDLSDYQDPNGKRIFVEFVKATETYGAGFVDYEWPKPGTEVPVPKISYVKLFPPWGWIVGTGVYVDDVEAEIANLMYIMLGIAGVTIVVGVGLSYVLARSISRPVHTLRQAAHTIAQGDIDQNIGYKARDEVGELAEAFRQMISYQQQMAEAAVHLAQGEVNVTVTPQSDKDVLGNAFHQMIANLRSAMDKTQILVGHLNNLPTPVIAIDREFNVTFVNPVGANWVGLTPEQCVGRKCYSLFKTPHCQSSECRLAQAMQQDGIFTGETVADPKGLNIPIRYTGAPIKNAGGQIVGALEYVVDITDLRSMMDKTQILVGHLNNLPTPVIAIDREFNVTFVNPVGANWVGLTPEQCVGRKCYSLFKTPHCQSSECRLAQAMQQDGIFTGETVADPKNLNIPIRYTGAPVKNASGQIVGALEYVVDITELRRLIDEANAQREYLAGEVNKLVAAMETLSRGDLNVSLSAQRQDEIAQIVDAANTLIAYQQQMAEAATRLAQGDLTVNITPQSDKDILGNAFSQMIVSLRDLIKQTQESAEQVASASQQLNTVAEQAGQAGQQVATTIQQIAQGTIQQTNAVTEAANNVTQMARAADGIARGAQEQAHGVQNTSDLINEMAAIVDQVGQVANSVTGANAKVTEAARHGATAVKETSQGMATIRTHTAGAAAKVKEMGARSKEIGRIVDTIDEIADKTDMLALNAAVEAARAGEHGRGFAVVADQVRKLSEDSKVATRDIGDLIDRVQETVNEAIAAMDSTVTEVDNGAQLAGETTQALQEIFHVAEEAADLAGRIGQAVNQLKQKSEGVVAAVEAVSTVVEENTAVAEQMAANSQEVTGAIEGVASIAEENSAATEEVSASAEEMSAQVEEVVASAEELSALAEQLRLAVAQFQLEETEWGNYGESKKRAERQQPQAVSTMAVKHPGNGRPSKLQPTTDN